MTDYMVEMPRPHTDVVVAEYTDYQQAQRLVDSMSDAGFPVEHVRIVGSDLHTVEQVTGRLTRARAALSGAGTGAWLGLFLGLMIGIFAPIGSWFGLLLTAIVVGALWGAVFGFVAQWLTRGQRDFSSVRGLTARRYRVEVDGGYEAEALRLAGQI